MSEAIFQPFPMLGGRRAQAWPYERPFRRPCHFHAEPELNLVVRGQGVIGVGDRRVAVSAGVVLLFQPGQDHALLEESPDFELFVLALTPELASRARTARMSVTNVFAQLSELELADAVLQVRASCESSDATSVEHNLSELFRAVMLRLEGSHALSRRALSLVHAEPTLSGASLAERLCTSQSVLSRALRQDIGVTFAEFRARLQLMQFVSLVDSGMSMHQAAHAADFGGYARCQQAFVRAIGCSPSDYFAGVRKQLDALTYHSVLAAKTSAMST